MTKGELIKFMEKWSDDTIVEVSSWPFHASIDAVQGEPIEGKAVIISNRDSWKMINESY